MFEDLTEKQIEILLYIKSEIQRQGYPPAVREICQGVGLKSTSTVHGHMNKLEKKGYIRKDPSKPRAIEIIDRDQDDIMQSKKTVDVPIVGKVTAGEPVLAVENIEDSMPIPYDLVKNHEVFILKVEGSSMINAGIFDGDRVLVKKQPVANNGEIVVALLEDEATLKKFYKEKDHIRLQPENDAMDPILTDNVSIIGKVIALYRTM